MGAGSHFGMVAGSPAAVCLLLVRRLAARLRQTLILPKANTNSCPRQDAIVISGLCGWDERALEPTSRSNTLVVLAPMAGAMDTGLAIAAAEAGALGSAADRHAR